VHAGHKYKELGHWASECDQPSAEPVVNGVLCPTTIPSRVYAMAKLHGRPIRCLLDSGCERSVVDRCFVSGLGLRRSRNVLKRPVTSRNAL